ncbi:hypothetical protein DFH29DRAFT_877486 [Suillus ampliporus]|nr:hypothetical protein DFH29DRAFT_877486 [Suillus ampliporus]
MPARGPSLSQFESQSLMWTPTLILPVILAFAQRWFHFCDPSRGRRKRQQPALKLDGFVYHSFDNPVESTGPGAVNDTATLSTSTDAQEPETEGDHSGSQSNSETVGIRSEPLDSLVEGRVWDDSQSADDATAAAPMTVRIESESNHESDLMDLINWLEE